MEFYCYMIHQTSPTIHYFTCNYIPTAPAAKKTYQMEVDFEQSHEFHCLFMGWKEKGLPAISV